MQLSVIDVSEHQGNINWEKVKNAGVVGAMISTFTTIYQAAKTLVCLMASITIHMLQMQ